VVDGDAPGILRARPRHVRGRVTACVEGNAAIAPREKAQLRLPAARVAGKFVHEDEGEALAGLLVVEAGAVAGSGKGHVQDSPAMICASSSRRTYSSTRSPTLAARQSNSV